MTATPDTNDELRESLLTMGESMLPFIEFAEGQRAAVAVLGWAEDAAAQHGAHVLAELTRVWFEAQRRQMETAELRRRKLEGLIG